LMSLNQKKKKKKKKKKNPCCNSGNQTFEHWLLECPLINYHRSKYLCLTDTSLNNINQIILTK